MFKNEVFFVCGIHGSGKTTFCKKLSTATDLPTFSSSDLIRERKKDISFNKNKRTSDIENNQNLLISAILEKLECYPKVLLDGHMTLLNNVGEITPIDFTVFSKMYISKIFLIAPPIEIIQNRIYSRDNACQSIENISLHMKKEEEHTYYVASQLGVSVYLLQGKDGDIESATKIIFKE